MMKPFALLSVLLCTLASVRGQTIELGTPLDGDVLSSGQNFTAQVILPESIQSCIQVGIALAIDNCPNGVCPQPTDQLGDVLYAGPWAPLPHYGGKYYQNFTLQVPTSLSGPAIFTLTHLCLLGAGPYPLLEFRNATVTVN